MCRSILGAGGLCVGMLGLGGALIAGVLLTPALRSAPAARALVLTSSTLTLDPSPREGGHPHEARGEPLPADFSYQGVILDESGVPAVGPIELTFGFFGIDIEGGTTIFLGGVGFTDIMPDAKGLFQVEIPIWHHYFLGSTIGHYLEIKNTITGEVISTTPVLPVPLAFYAHLAGTSTSSITAEYAEDAGTAELAIRALDADFATTSEQTDIALFANSALTANTATTALSAGMLTNDASINLTLLAPFAPYDSGWDSPKATRVGRMVHLSGLVRPINNGVAAQPIAVLPVGMRPGSKIMATAYTSGYQTGTGPLARIDIFPDGTVIYSAPAPLAGNWFSLTGISFPVGP